MTLALDHNIKKLGEGSVIKLSSGKSLFMLDSYPGNPIIKPQDISLTWQDNGKLKIGAVFNGGAELFQNKILLMPRCQKGYQKKLFFDKRLGIERNCLENYISEVWPLVSNDGINFSRFQNTVIHGDGADHHDFTYGIEDIRIIKHGHKFLLVGCGKIKPPFKESNADRIAVYSTENFMDITYNGMVESFDTRNSFPMPELINGHLFMLLRFNPNIHLERLKEGMDQLLNPNKYKKYWQEIYERREQNILLEAGSYLHEKEKIGSGAQIIKTDNGWLLIYHAVGEIEEEICKAYGLKDKIKRGYSICAAILDMDDPRRVLCRTKYPIYIPSAPYELYGNDEYQVDVPAVVFPVGAIVRKGKLIIYAGSGDKYTILLSCSLNKLINYLCDKN